MSNKYNVGDKFVIEITKKHPLDSVYSTQYYTTDNGLFLSEAFLDKAELIEEKRADWWSDGYNSGLNDAWEAAKRICLPEEDGGFSIKELREIFGSVYTAKALKSNTASEAITKIREFDEKAENAKI